MTAAVIGVFVIVAVAVVLRFEFMVLTDIAHTTETRLLPKPAWAFLAIVTIPLGGILYWLYGRAG